ncbi:hypothetical protein MO973_12060 [Paenibacillus sp. TRM 82003]|nr:hypothetical protein [Paenibacillus sp. TRM 82003]
MVHQLLRISVVCVGIAAISLLYPKMHFYGSIADDRFFGYVAGMFAITFLVGWAVEWIPFPRKIRPAWASLIVTVAVMGGICGLQYTGALVIWFGHAPWVQAFLSSPWSSSTSSLVLGMLIGKALRG